jgi:RNA polymerase sigma factor (TIGR02999 family)
MAEVTELLARWSEGDAQALEQLMPVVYGELYQLARLQMRRERPDHTLQPTALVHEAYMRLISGRDATFENRTHFYGAAARAMRRILVDHARHRNALKRAPPIGRLPLDEGPPNVDLQLDLVALDRALEGLAAIAANAAQVVELRYFGGLSIEETAAVLGIAPATVKRHWTFARAWLHRALVES